MTDQLPLSTVPTNLSLALMNFPDDQEFIQKFSDEMSVAIVDCGRFLDLERLAGVTVGYDFDAALASVDLGYESGIATQYTNNGDVVAVAKAMNVLRDGKVMSHVVYNANVIVALVDPTNEYHLDALHIIAHEFGHVAELKWRDEAMPGLMLTRPEGEWVDVTLLQTILTAWEEYAACRMTGTIGDRQALKLRYAAELDRAAGYSLARAQEQIKQYRTHGDVNRLLINAGEPIAMPFKMAGYLLGHLDAIDAPDLLEDLCPVYANSHLVALMSELRKALRNVWSERDAGKGIGVFDPLKSLILQAYSAAGIDLAPGSNGHGYYVSVPCTAETMPNGEADMAIVLLRRKLGLD
ncbi:hypothetical protein [Pseudoxanthomonas sp. JBR18]|uniref:hypothetical protein n=1 Tax=Pseudoxanthomonas sp. JBR18 TaxID=2969308 RepID=UPI0023050C8B|nr:hypothetical protein [Pseudoxanthomonas sp. JBR18]WCE03962.1 hypothetical protein PJ250_18080 [Pseudoxanthomonas sp. JBR18]